MRTHMHTVCVHDYMNHRNLQNHNNDVWKFNQNTLFTDSLITLTSHMHT